MRLHLFAALAVFCGLSLFGFGKKADLDQAVLDQLRKAGSDLSKPHNIEFFLYFPAEAAASKACTQIQNMGFRVTVERAAKGPDWLCFATMTMVPDVKVLQKTRRDFNSIAAANGGHYDGWGTGVVE